MLVHKKCHIYVTRQNFCCSKKYVDESTEAFYQHKSTKINDTITCLKCLYSFYSCNISQMLLDIFNIITIKDTIS